MANSPSHDLHNIYLNLFPFVLFFFLIVNPSDSLAAPVSYNVMSYGAKPDSTTDSTKAFSAAWEGACGSKKPSTMYVPAGRFLLHNVVFQGQCNNDAVSVEIDGTLVAPSDYKVTAGSETWVLFEDVNGVSVSGGTLDGQGAALWACKNSGHGCPRGTATLRFTRSENIQITGLTSVNSQLYHIVVEECSNVKMTGIKVSAAGDSPNTDGIHVESSTDVSIFNSRIATGDDCVSIGPGTTNLWIEKVACGPGHGISVGSLGKEVNEAGVENVTVKTTTFSGTENGLRIKTWGNPSHGFARNIVFEDAVMNNVKNPIIIDQQYCPDDRCSEQKMSGVKISEVTYEDIGGTSATEIGVKLDCSRDEPCSDIKMENINLKYHNEPAKASCVNAQGITSTLIQPIERLCVRG